MTEFQHIEYLKNGAIAVICINRPDVMNCIAPQTHDELVTAWGDVKKDDNIKVAILTGAGEEAFCSGADLKAVSDAEFSKRMSLEEIKAHKQGLRDGFIGPSRWTDIDKPIIAAVNGVAYAGGLEWACFADMRIVEEHATFGVTCRRWNIGLGDGGTQRLRYIVGLGHAMELILTGKVIDAQEAYRMGLANEVVSKGTALQRATDLAEYLCTLPQPAMRSDKEAVYRGLGTTLSEGLKIEAQCFFKSFSAPETAKGLRQFVKRDHPDRRSDQTSITPGLK